MLVNIPYIDPMGIEALSFYLQKKDPQKKMVNKTHWS